MTTLTKKLTRSLPRPIDRADWVTELDSVGVTFRRKRSSRRYTISWEAVWNKAMHIAAEQERKEKIERHKKRKVA